MKDSVFNFFTFWANMIYQVICVLAIGIMLLLSPVFWLFSKLGKKD